MDIFSAEKRSEVMSKISRHDARPELALRSLLQRHGYRFTVRSPKNKTPVATATIFLDRKTSALILQGAR